MRVVMPLPDRDFDVTEVAVPWRVLTTAGHEVVFASERAGASLAADPRLLTGVLFGRLGAEPEPQQFYRQMVDAAGFRAPIGWADLQPDEYDGMILPGGHAPGMRQYLGSDVVFGLVALRRHRSHPPSLRGRKFIAENRLARDCFASLAMTHLSLRGPAGSTRGDEATS